MCFFKRAGRGRWQWNPSNRRDHVKVAQVLGDFDMVVYLRLQFPHPINVGMLF